MCLYILYILLDSLLGLCNCTSVRETSFLLNVFAANRRVDLTVLFNRGKVLHEGVASPGRTGRYSTELCFCLTLDCRTPKYLCSDDVGVCEVHPGCAANKRDKKTCAGSSLLSN